MQEIVLYNNTPNYGTYIFKEDSIGLWTADRTGSNQKFQIKGFNEYFTSCWSPDGKWLAFSDSQSLYKIAYKNSEFDSASVSIIRNNVQPWYPVWSPDGNWIAFGSGNGIKIIKNNGDDYKYIPRSLHGHWHPDSKRIISKTFDVTESGTSFLIHYPFEDTSPDTLLARPDCRNKFPKFSPDGKKIAFVSISENESQINIWLMDINGNNLSKLTECGTNAYFDWSPDGTAIVYVKYNFNDWSYENGTLWEIDINTHQNKQITFNNKPGLK